MSNNRNRSKKQRNQSGGNNNGGGGSPRKSASRNRRRRNKAQSKKFWAEGQPLPPLDVVIDPTPDPGAVVRSLGEPPLAGQNHKSAEYFDLVYQRSVGLATALAAAGGLPIADDESGT